MSSHGGPPAPGGPRRAPEPSPAERARTIADLGRTGTLATRSRRHQGYPFASVMPYALDGVGRPLFLISHLAMHTQNLEADGRASLLVTPPGAALDPLASARVTLMGQATPVPPADTPAARDRYLARQPSAVRWVDFEDFAFWRLELVDVYWVGGFAAMDWVTAAAFLGARPDPLGDVAPAIAEHMNRDHAEALLLFARVLSGESADRASMVEVDRLGFKLKLESGDRVHTTRIGFPRAVATADDARAVLIAMVAECRGRASASP